MRLIDVLSWLETGVLATALRGAGWLYPLVETGHILSFALLFGSIAVVDLRLLGLGTPLPVGALARHALPWTLAGMAGAALTGILLFVSDARATALNPAFQAKLALLALAALNAAQLHARYGRRLPDWPRVPAAARLSAALSLLLWTGVILTGRLIAYL